MKAMLLQAGLSVLLVLVGGAGGEVAVVRGGGWLEDRAGRVFCSALLLRSSHLVVPAHCLVAGRLLPGGWRARLALRAGGLTRRAVRPKDAVVHPGFRLHSFTGEPLVQVIHRVIQATQVIRVVQDLAVVPLARPARRAVSARLVGRPPGPVLTTAAGQQVGRLGEWRCRVAGLGPYQLCLAGEGNVTAVDKDRADLLARQLESIARLDPRQTSYRTDCWTGSGAGLVGRGGRVQAVSLIPVCYPAPGLALPLAPYMSWIRAAVTAEMRQTGRRGKLRSLRILHRSQNIPQL